MFSAAAAAQVVLVYSNQSIGVVHRKCIHMNAALSLSGRLSASRVDLAFTVPSSIDATCWPLDIADTPRL